MGIMEYVQQLVQRVPRKWHLNSGEEGGAGTALPMRVSMQQETGPSGSAFRSGSQTATSCCG